MKNQKKRGIGCSVRCVFETRSKVKKGIGAESAGPMSARAFSAGPIHLRWRVICSMKRAVATHYRVQSALVMRRYRTSVNGRFVRVRQATVEAVECPKEMESGVSAHQVATGEEPWRSRAAAGSGQSSERLTGEHRYDASRGDNVGRWRRIGAFMS